MTKCPHTSQIQDVQARTSGCEDKHATKHFHSSTHPIAKSIEPGEDWGWCYIDKVELDFA